MSVISPAGHAACAPPVAAGGDVAQSDLDTRFFSATVREGIVRTRGVAAYTAGHRIPRHGGKADDGIFAEWRWDGDQLTAVNDRYGMHPLFFCAVPGAIWIAPSIPTLVREGAPAELDWDGLSVFLRIGFFIGDDTPFARIKALPPGARLHWRDGQIELHGGPFLRPAEPLERAAALDGYIELFRTAIRRRVPAADDFAVPLSGGRDSRHILLELCRQGRRPTFCVTTKHYPPRTNEDARIAALLAAAAEVPHLVLDQHDRFDAELRKNVATSFCSDEHAWTLTLADFLRGRARVVFDGLGGDVLSAGLFLRRQWEALYATDRIADLAAALFPQRIEHTLALVLHPDVRRRVSRGRAVRRIADEIARHAGAAHPIGSFFFWNRTRREIALVPYAILCSVGGVFTPYLDHDLYDFLAALPVHLLRDHRLHSDAIRRAYPRFREVPFQAPGVVPPSGWVMRRDMLRRLARYARGRTATLTRRSAALVNWSSFAHRFFDVGPLIPPELILYLLQLDHLSQEPGSKGADQVTSR